MQFFLSVSIGLNLLLIFFTIRILKNNTANMFLLAMLVIVLIGTSYVISLNYFAIQSPLLAHIINSLPSLIGSLVYLYVYYSINTLVKIRLNFLLHLWPFFISIPFSYYDVSEISTISIVLNIGLKIIVSIIYFIFSLKILSKHKAKIRNHYSKTEKIDLGWLVFVVKAGLVSYLIYLIIMSLWAIDVNTFSNLEVIANIVVLFFIFAISYYSLSSTKIFDKIAEFNINIDEQDDFSAKSLKVNERKELVSAAEAAIIMQRIIAYIESDKVFKNENLMLEDISKELNLHSKYVSYVINTVSGKNFFDFINHFRIAEFNKEVLESKNKNLTLLSIAYDCGFGSKSAFSRAYKSEMGISPTQFIKQMKT